LYASILMMTVMADIHEGLDSVLALIGHDLLTNIEVVREYSEIPPFVCHARKLNRVFFNISIMAKSVLKASQEKGQSSL